MEIALVYMVAGLSSRFGGKVKQFARVGKNQETLIECSLNQALPSGFTKIIFIVGNKTQDLFKEKFGNEYKGIPIQYALQNYNPETRDRPWGTTDAVCSAKDIIDCPFVLCNGDDLYGENSFKIIVNHLKNPENKGIHATIGYKLGKVLPETGKVNRGIFKVNEQGYVENIVEMFDIEKNNLQEKGLDEENMCSMNMLGFFPEILPKLNQILENFKQENQGNRKIECLLPKNLSELTQKSEIKMKVYSNEEKCYGVTNPEDEEKLRKELSSL
jgi:choline kinase